MAAPSKRIDALADQLESEVKNRIAKAPTPQAAVINPNQEQRLAKLETGMVELKAQGKQFHAWFEETGTRLASQDQCLQALQQSFTGQQADIAAVRAEVHSTAENIHHGMAQTIATLKTDLATEMVSTLDARMDRFEKLVTGKSPRKD